MLRRMSRYPSLLVALVVAFTWTVVGVHGQSGAKNGEWRWYGGDAGHTRYSPLDQINASNFSNLTVAWRFKTEHLGPRPEFQFESTPLMANGVLYSTAGTRRAVVAIDPETGEELWVHSEREGARASVAPRQLSGRGLAYWTDGKEERILYVTIGYQLVALNAKTGVRVPTFGNNGIIDLKQNDDQVIDPMSAEIGLHSTPMIAGNVVIIGAAHKSGSIPTGKTNVKGYVRGFDVRTGKRLWIFHTIPQPGEFGNETWLNDSWSYTGNTGAWGQISIDEELGMAYLPVESATGDYFGADRPGANLFAESLVAVDLKTGRRKWHYQLVHHGIWDHDIPCPPILVDINRNGKIIKAVAQPTKQAFLYVFDRVTGQPLWPIEERPVPKGDVPGEWYSPTQPFPLDGRGRPFNYDAQGFVVDDLLDFTPELRAEGMKVLSKYKIGPVFTPPVVSKVEGPARYARAGVGRRRDELAGRLVRSRNRHSVCELAKVDQPARARAASPRLQERSRVHPGQRGGRGAGARRSDGGCARGGCTRRGWARGVCAGACPDCAAGPSGRRWGRWWRIDGSRAAAHETAIRADQRHRSDQGGNHLAGRARRDAGRHSEQSSAEGIEHSPYGPARRRRIARDEDAARVGRSRLRSRRRAARAAPCFAPTTKPQGKKWARSTCLRLRPDRR